MLTIGLTGGIASGKSLAGHMLASLGARVVDADRVAHQTYVPGTEGFRALVEAFGRDIVDPAGNIDRAELGRRVFDDPAELARLTFIVWPLTRRLVESLRAEALADGAEVFVVEAALLFDAGWQAMFDEVWFVRSPRDTVLARLAARGLSPEEAERRLQAATDADTAARHATRIIENDGTLDQLESRIRKAWDAARNRSGHPPPLRNDGEGAGG